MERTPTGGTVVRVGGPTYARRMSERTETVTASVLTIGFAVAAAMWMISISAWGPAVFSVVLAAIIVWSLVSAERHRGASRIDVERHNGNEMTWS